MPMNITNTFVRGIEFEERNIDIGFAVGLLLLTAAFLFEAGAIIYLLTR